MKIRNDKQKSVGMLFAIMVLSIIFSAGVCAANLEDEKTGLKNSAVMKGNETSTAIGVSYRTHVQNVGWETTWASDGETAGTEGQSLRLEGIQINLTGNLPEGAGIEYRTHVQNVGWETNWATAGGTAGTEGQSLRLEGIQIRLVNMPGYSVEYRTHVQNVGWETTWASDGETAGTEGQSLRLEGIQIRMVKNGADPVIKPTVDLTNKVDVSPDGGNIALTDGATLAVPTGALEETKTITLDRWVEQSGSESEASAIYCLTGLPETWQAPLEVSLPMQKDQPEGTSTYVVINGGESYRSASGETGANRTLIEATVIDGMAKVRLSSNEGMIISSLQKDSQFSTMEEGTEVDLAMYVETGIYTKNAGNFKVIVSDQLKNEYPAIVDELANSLMEASSFIESDTGVNLSYAGGRSPMPVEIFAFDGFLNDYWGKRSKDTWGYLEIAGYTRESQISNAWISINALKLGDADASQQIKATVAHELFHYYEQLYLPIDGKSQVLLQDASCVWMEFEVMKNNASYWPTVLGPEDASSFPKNGLLRDYDTACHTQGTHDIAASLFLRYMTDKYGTTAMGDLWRSVRDNDEEFKALADGFQDVNWYLEWPEFVQKLYAGDYTQAMDSDAWAMHTNPYFDQWSVNDPYTQKKWQFDTTMYPLAAKGFQINLRYGEKEIINGDKVNLMITNENSDNVVLYVYRRIGNGTIEYLSEINSEIPFVLMDLGAAGKQSVSIIAASKWQPTAANMNESREIGISAEIVNTTAYDALVAAVPANNDKGTYTNDSWTLFRTAIDGCNLNLTAVAGQEALDAEVIKIQTALNQLVKANGVKCYCGYQHDFSKLTRHDEGAICYFTKGAYTVEGPYLQWYDESRSQLKSACCYSENEWHGRVMNWYQNGTTKSEYSYKYGKRDGLQTEWLKDGTMSYMANYKNDVKYGSETSWYENGVKWTESNYVEGKLNGLQTEWYENSNKKCEGNYTDDEKTGVWYFWNSDGKLSFSKNYDTGDQIIY